MGCLYFDALVDDFLKHQHTMDIAFDTPFGPQRTRLQALEAIWNDELQPIYVLFPVWLWTIFALITGLWLLYFKDRIVAWKRARRWRIQKRRLAGIPDSDKREFSIAKKDAEERSAMNMQRAFLTWEETYLTTPVKIREASPAGRLEPQAELSSAVQDQTFASPSPVRNIPSPPPDEQSANVLQITCTPQQVWQYFFDYGLLESDEWPDIHDQESVKVAFQLAMIRLEERGGTLNIAEVQP